MPKSSRRKLKTIVAVGLAAVLVIVVGSIVGISLHSSGEDQAKATIGEQGFDITLDGARVSAPAGVAPEGTEVQVKLIDSPLPSGWSDFATPVGVAIEVILGDSLQPAEPLTIELEASDADATQNELLVIASEDHEPLPANGAAYGELTGVQIEQSSVTGNTVIAQVQHLSWFTVIRVSGASMLDKLTQTLRQGLGIGFAQPPCYDVPATIGGYSIGLTAESVNDGLWPCVEIDASGDLLVQLYSNSGLTWVAGTVPEGTSTLVTGELSLEAAVAVLAGVSVYPTGGNRTFIPPGSHGDLLIDMSKGVQSVLVDAPQADAQAIVDPALSYLINFTLVLSAALPDIPYAEIAKCASNVMPDFADANEALRDDTAIALTKTVLECGISLSEGVVAEVVGLMLDSIGAVAMNIEGVARELAGSGITFTFEIEEAPVFDSEGVSTESVVYFNGDFADRQGYSFNLTGGTGRVSVTPEILDAPPGLQYLHMESMLAKNGFGIWNIRNTTPNRPLVFDSTSVFSFPRASPGFVLMLIYEGESSVCQSMWNVVAYGSANDFCRVQFDLARLGNSESEMTLSAGIEKNLFSDTTLGYLPGVREGEEGAVKQSMADPAGFELLYTGDDYKRFDDDCGYEAGIVTLHAQGPTAKNSYCTLGTVNEISGSATG